MLACTDIGQSREELLLDVDPSENLAPKFACTLNHRVALPIRWMQAGGCDV
jgi:hypothetical protein